MELHLVDRRGRHQYDWVTFHAQYISLWAARSECIATTPLAITSMDFYDPYMQWYRHITRRLIAPILHRDHMRFHNATFAIELLIIVVSQMAISNDLEETHQIAIDVLHAIGEDHRVHSTQEPSTSSGSSMRPPSLITLVRVPPIIGRGRGGRRAEFIASPPITESIAPPPIIESIAPLPFLEWTTHAARLHVRLPRGCQTLRVRQVLHPSVPSNSTTHVDGVS
uniref:Serine/threonine-protein phosphatase 7 long form-like n=1 Tax=Vitis vinifera TaxID=29760 RepID=A5BN14_VITVI|nr:hypothetical protein VITISV_000310 [Vitis vinifera]